MTFDFQMSEWIIYFTDGGTVWDHYPSDGGGEGLLQEGVWGSEGCEEICLLSPSHAHQGLLLYL